MFFYFFLSFDDFFFPFSSFLLLLSADGQDCEVLTRDRDRSGRSGFEPTLWVARHDAVQTTPAIYRPPSLSPSPALPWDPPRHRPPLCNALRFWLTNFAVR